VVAWASANHWRIPEHFDASWAPQLELNADRPDDPFKPYGATVGHGLEWARLLLHVDAALPGRAPETLVPAARALYGGAVRDGWSSDDAAGFVYTTDWAGVPVVRTRLHWVAAEAIGAAAALHQVTGDPRYADDYACWWDYAAQYLLDRERGPGTTSSAPERVEPRGLGGQAGSLPRVPGNPAPPVAPGPGARARHRPQRRVGEAHRSFSSASSWCRPKGETWRLEG